MSSRMEARGEQQDDDYMSDLFVSQAADIRPGLSGNRKRKNVESTRTSLTKKTKPKMKGRLEKHLRQEGLGAPIADDNKGYSLLLKMGYKPGTSLGKTGEDGLKNPIPIDIKEGREGIGREAFVQERKVQETERKSQKAAEDMEMFRFRKKQQFSDKRIERDFRKCQMACENLDCKMGIKEPVVNWYWFSYTDPVEDYSEEPSEPVISVEDQLAGVTDYLRTVHHYCVWCGCSFKDDEDMLDQCPGNSVEDHDN